MHWSPLYIHIVECGVAFDTLCIGVQTCTVVQNVHVEDNLGTSYATSKWKPSAHD